MCEKFNFLHSRAQLESESELPLIMSTMILDSLENIIFRKENSPQAFEGSRDFKPEKQASEQPKKQAS